MSYYCQGKIVQKYLYLVLYGLFGLLGNIGLIFLQICNHNANIQWSPPGLKPGVPKGGILKRPQRIRALKGTALSRVV